MAVNSRIWLSPPHMSGREQELVQDAFESNWIAPLGPHVDAFERELSDVTGAPFVAALSSGTAALHLALLLLGVEQGDEVIVQSLTFSASANPVVYQKATPVFVDSERDTWNLSPGSLEEAIRDRIKRGKKPRAVIGVHIYGMPCKLDEVCGICEKYEIPFIEDAAEALGSFYRDTPVGGFGAFGILSFNGNKIITTSGGGALLGKNKDLISRARFLSTQAKDDAPHYEHSTIGYNYRLSNVLAAIGRGQLSALSARVERRRAVFEMYRNRLSASTPLSFLPEPQGSRSNRWLTTVTTESHAGSSVSPDVIRLDLASDNIESRPLWKPLHLQPVFKECPFYGDGTAEDLFTRGICLPSGSSLSEDDVDRVCTRVEALFA
jgi:dTDP-4-amino-4,6-dideoxygalactose transaminase